MKAFPSNLGPAPRQAAGLLWRLDPDNSTLWIQSDPITPLDFPGWELVTEYLVPLPSLGEQNSYTLAVACQKTPPSQVPPDLRAAVKAARVRAQTERQAIQAAGREQSVDSLPAPKGSYRSKKITVPAAERREWFIARMARNGFEVDPNALMFSDLQQARLASNKGRIPFINTVFTARVTDSELARKAVVDGVGAGRSYGLSLLINLDKTLTNDSSLIPTEKGL